MVDLEKRCDFARKKVERIEREMDEKEETLGIAQKARPPARAAPSCLARTHVPRCASLLPALCRHSVWRSSRRS